MRTIIAGGRDIYPSMEEIFSAVSKLPATPTEIICGGCSGVDSQGEKWAIENDYRPWIFPANFKKLGRAIGPERNRMMAMNADALVLFWDGKSPGSTSMKKWAEHYKLFIVEVIY